MDVIDEVLAVFNSEKEMKANVENWAIDKIKELTETLDDKHEIESLTLLIKDLSGIEDADHYNEIGIDNTQFKRKQRRKVKFVLKKEIIRTPTDLLKIDQIRKDSFKGRGFRDKVFR